MSAYLCPNHHLAYLAAAAVRLPNDCLVYRLASGELRTINHHDWEAATAAANLLQRQNLASLAERYPNDPPEFRENPTPVRFREIPRVQHLDPVQVLMSCDCYDYQACHTADWERSDVRYLVDAIRSAAIRRLPGYCDAIWGAPSPV